MRLAKAYGHLAHALAVWQAWRIRTTATRTLTASGSTNGQLNGEAVNAVTAVTFGHKAITKKNNYGSTSALPTT